jgi:hypothetical protein
MPCTFIALFNDAATARRAKDGLSAVAGVDRAYEPGDVEDAIAELRIALHEADELREGQRRGEHVLIIDIWSADPTACEVIEAMAGANLLVRTEREDAANRASRVPSPFAIEGVRSDFYIG